MGLDEQMAHCWDGLWYLSLLNTFVRQMQILLDQLLQTLMGRQMMTVIIPFGKIIYSDHSELSFQGLCEESCWE